MKKVYVVIANIIFDMDGSVEVVGVYDTEEKAKNAMQKRYDSVLSEGWLNEKTDVVEKCNNEYCIYAEGRSCEYQICVSYSVNEIE